MAIFRDLHLRNPELMRDRAFVAGKWVETPSVDRITVTDPFDGSAIADRPSSLAGAGANWVETFSSQPS